MPAYRKSHQDMPPNTKEGHTCTAGVGQLRSGRVSEQYEVANTRSYRADYRLRLVVVPLSIWLLTSKPSAPVLLNCVTWSHAAGSR